MPSNKFGYLQQIWMEFSGISWDVGFHGMSWGIWYWMVTKKCWDFIHSPHYEKNAPMVDHESRLFDLGWDGISGKPKTIQWLQSVIYPLVMTNIAVENSPFIDDFPIKTSIYKGFLWLWLTLCRGKAMALIEIDDFPSELNLHLWLGIFHGYIK